MKKLVYTLLLSVIVSLKVQAQCSGNEQSGTVSIVPPTKDKLLTYNIYHGFTLIPGTPTLPVVKTITYNHAYVKETGGSCATAVVNPPLQPAGFDSLKKDTMIENTIFNNNVPVNYKITTISPSGTGGTITDSAFAFSCVSKAKASTCLQVNPFAAGMPVTGEIQCYGFGQSLNPPVTADAFAISIGDVTAESTRKLKDGTIVWVPWVESLSKGKAHGIRQKGGTNDPITYFIHNYTTGLDYTGTLLTISMTFYTDTDTFTYHNKWRNDTVVIQSDSALFSINFPSPSLTSANGSLIVEIGGGVVTQAIGTGIFSSVPLPLPGSPVPVVFPLQNILNFNYNLGNFGNDSLQVIINMFGNSINNHVPASMIQVYDSVNRVKCFGQNTGSIYLNTVGDYPPFAYLWNNGSIAKNRPSVKAGTYTVTVTDAMGNTVSKTIVVTQPPKLLSTVTKTNIKCGGKSTGKITLNVTGGTPPYFIIWNTGETGNYIDSLIAGVYTATITDANGCTLIKNVTLTENPPLTVSAFSLGGDSAMAIGTGGVPPYVYRWFTLPAQSTQIAYGLTGGSTYKVRVTDVKGCTATVMYTHPFSRFGNVSPIDEINIQPNPTDGKITIHLTDEQIKIYEVSLYDVTGQMIFSVSPSSENKILNYDINYLLPGVYMVHLKYNDSIKILKLVKQ